MRVLLLGGSGFIGKRVMRRLQRRGHDVIIFHRGEPQPTTVRAEHITGNRLEIDQHISQIKAARPDAVIDFLPWNDRDTRLVIDALNERVARVVHISSGDVYRAWGHFLSGRYGEPVPLHEDAPLREKLYPYAGSRPGMEDYDKVLAEREIFKAHYEEGYPGSIIRLPMVYGPGDNQHRTWPHVKRILDNRPAILLGSCHAAWLWHRGFVDNVAFAIVLAAERDASVGQAYNAGSLRTLSVAAWVRAIGEIMDWDGEIVLLPQQQLPQHLATPYTYQQHLIYDTSKIRRELGYDELVDFESGLRKTIEWQIKNSPHNSDPARFNYAVEDALLKEVVAGIG